MSSLFNTQGVLALQCSHSWWGDGTFLWGMFVLWSSNREWFLLRHVPGWAKVSSYLLILYFLLYFHQCMVIFSFKCDTIEIDRRCLGSGYKLCECFLGMLLNSRGVSSTEFGDLETLCKTVVKEKQPFERLEVTKETLLKMFKVRSNRIIAQHRTNQ